MAGGVHEWFDLSDRPDRRDHVHSFFPWSALTAAGSERVGHDLRRPSRTCDRRAADTPTDFRYIQWGPVIAGALLAAALALVLHAFAVGLGLSMSSTAPTWRDASFFLVLLSGLYLLLIAFISYGLGAYVAGRLRTAPHSRHYGRNRVSRRRARPPGVGARDPADRAARARRRAGGDAACGAEHGQAGPAASATGENIIAYDLDRLFRSERPPQGDMTYTRGEAARILLTVSSHRGIQDDDRAYLVRLVTSRTGLAQPEAERRVNEVVGRVKDDIERARKTAVILAFMGGAAAMLGAAVAWFAACAGGRDRDDSVRSILYGWWHTSVAIRR